MRANNALVPALVACAAAFALCALINIWLLTSSWSKARLLDKPTGRGLHIQPTPRGGGLGIVVAVMGCWLALFAFFPFEKRIFLGFITTALSIAAIGWLDDLLRLSSRGRFVMQTIVAVTAIIFFGPFTLVLTPFALLDLSFLGWPVTALWLVGCINAYNFMDGSNGIAALQGTISGIAWFFIGHIVGAMWLSVLGLSVSGACLGFLLFNFPRAKLFMGDTGSLFLGFVFGVLPITGFSHFTKAQAWSAALIVGFCTLWTFILDAGLTFLKRLLSGENAFVPHRTHLFQRLIRRGKSHTEVALLYALLGCVGGAFAVDYAVNMSLRWLIFLGGFALPFGLAVLWLVPIKSAN